LQQVIAILVSITIAYAAARAAAFAKNDLQVAEICENPRISLMGALSHDTAAQAAKRQRGENP
jgi:hypothetical protein